MTLPVVNCASYILVHTPDLIKLYGTTCAMEEEANPASDFLRKLPQHLRSFSDVVKYPPNQVYIGNLVPDDLKAIPRPWFTNLCDEGKAEGKLGMIVSQEEFYLVLKLCDTFDLITLENEFQAQIIAEFGAKARYSNEEIAKLKNGLTTVEIEQKVDSGAAPLYFQGRLVGCVRAAHESDKNLSSHVMVENLACKASAVIALKDLINRNSINPASIEYVIECSEEACGDMNQRGGGNFAKAVSEIAGISGATGSDLRGFCAAPAHALISAAALVQSGVYKSVAIVAGGATAKLGMNARDHVNKEIPVLEDCLGGFAVLITQNDGVSPIIRTDVVGRHTVSTGSSPQAVMEALITKPLDQAGLKITDIDKYSAEMQNPEITEPAGAGDVPLANYKMIAALGVKKGVLEKTEMPEFIASHGMPGFAPTQGHIPSGVPYLGHALHAMREGQINTAMIIGKGSLFLGRMTNLFDGVSVVIAKNNGISQVSTAPQVNVSKRAKIKIALSGLGSEHGVEELIKGAEMAAEKYEELDVVLLGPKNHPYLQTIEVRDEDEMHRKLNELLERKELDAAVTMHYNFPIGVATVGRMIAPANGRDMLLATTTGTMSAGRVEAMIMNTLAGISVAKTLGKTAPTVGILNVDGARALERVLTQLKDNGYEISFGSSVRADGGCIMRGNDLLMRAADVMVMDTLTGNLLMKIFSAFNSGGNYETLGYGYGPGVGLDYEKIICIISRASGAPVICEALKYAADCVKGDLPGKVREEFKKAKTAGLEEILASKTWESQHTSSSSIKPATSFKPEKKPVTKTISGIDIMELDNAVVTLGEIGIYSESGMGCTGPVILVAEEDYRKAAETLCASNYISALPLDC